MASDPDHAARLPDPRGSSATTDELVQEVYSELARFASHALSGDPSGWMMQTGTLVHEAYLRLLGNGAARWQSRSHFFGAAVVAMRRILVEKVRAHRAMKRGAGRAHVSWADHDAPDGSMEVIDIVALDQALGRLESQDPRMAAVASLRFFAGLSVPETARLLDLAESSVHREWIRARAWLARELAMDESEPGGVERGPR